eukprot:5239949-Amphidinium_carterae.1
MGERLPSSDQISELLGSLSMGCFSCLCDTTILDIVNNYNKLVSRSLPPATPQLLELFRSMKGVFGLPKDCKDWFTRMTLLV